jgi:methionyl-tRNA formyltransferase
MAGRRLRTVFFGSAAFAVPSLERLLSEHEVLAVCSQPPRPAGRGLRLTPTPVAAAAGQAEVPVLTPARLDAEFVRELSSLRPELLACAAYGKILPAAVLSVPSMAALNVHPSLLPAYRGATPIQAALRDGCDVTGVTVFWMGAGMDDGDIALQEAIPIDPDDTYGTLHDKLATAGGRLLGEAVARLASGNLPRVPQDHSRATYTRPLSKDDLKIRWDAPAAAVVNQIRSLSPKPGAWMLYAGKRLKVLEAAVESAGGTDGVAAPGEVVAIDRAGVVVAARPGWVRLRRLVLEGKPPMTGEEFATLAGRIG